MLLTSDGTPDNKGAQNASDVIFDADTETFQQTVLESSMYVPILVDFWAPWCGPCKQLTPLLERVVQSYGGAIKLAKVNLDENPQLAQAFRVQSVPTVYAVFGGQPVDGFQGAVPEGTIRQLIDKILEAVKQSQPEAQNIEEALKQAEELLADQQPEMALGLFQHILQNEETNAQAYSGAIRALLALQQFEQAEILLNNAPDSISSKPEMSAARSAIALSKDAPSEPAAALQKKVEASPKDQAVRFDYARALYASGQSEEAIEQLLLMIDQDRAWNEEAARKQILKIFEALGHSHPLTVQGRKKLSSVLFS